MTRFPLLEEKAILRGFCVLDMDVRIFDARGNFVKGVDSPECALVVLRGDVKTFDIVAALASVREHWGDDGTAVLFHCTHASEDAPLILNDRRPSPAPWLWDFWDARAVPYGRGTGTESLKRFGEAVKLLADFSCGRSPEGFSNVLGDVIKSLRLALDNKNKADLAAVSTANTKKPGDPVRCLSPVVIRHSIHDLGNRVFAIFQDLQSWSEGCISDDTLRSVYVGKGEARWAEIEAIVFGRGDSLWLRKGGNVPVAVFVESRTLTSSSSWSRVTQLADSEEANSLRGLILALGGGEIEKVREALSNCSLEKLRGWYYEFEQALRALNTEGS